ncbi:MAG: tRNA pseudouridine(55) synthase TruB [Gammaproteobacteria bacterium]|nr:tRNA pseudouridine(55) synthase TruB [Gammaproteobacteria bacterium]
MARRKTGRDISGILLFDKPIGMSSNAVLQRVKRIFSARKAGHTGSLDPLATGLLPICLGEATKMSGFLLDADKRYQVTIKLGIKTSTGDAEGDAIFTREVGNYRNAELALVLAEFQGDIEQIPPMYSALKKDGQPLYKLARKGIEVERQVRNIKIHSIEMLAAEGDLLELDVHCSKGTYIRTLAEDIGERLGCGAHVAVLRRLSVGPFSGEKMITPVQLENIAEEGGFEALDRLLLPMENALVNWPEVRLPQDAAFFLKRGQAVVVPQAPREGLVKLFAEGNVFLGVGYIMDDGRVAPRRLLNIA